MRRNKKLYLQIFILLIILAIVSFSVLYIVFFNPNVHLPQGKKYVYIYVPTGAGFEQLMDTLNSHNLLKNQQTFRLAAKIKRFRYPKPGRYKIMIDFNNNQLINILRAGLQSPVRLTFNNIRTKEQLAGRVSRYLEADSLSILNLLYNDDYLRQFGFSSEDVLAMFIPNTYEFFWNTDARVFIKRMYREYRKFWTPQRLQKAREIGLSPKQVIILASIVQSEQMKHPDEWPRIAGLYINRLRRGIPLQSDPTLIYAWQDFSIKRVYNFHKNIDSPYNTYKYAGLPPGPIITPDPRAIDAVLDYEHHNYLYMVARADMSGYHHFSRTLAEHNYYARQYQRALSKLGIR